MKDPKKQAQAQAQERKVEDLINGMYGNKLIDWYEILEGKDVVTEPRLMILYGDYLLRAYHLLLVRMFGQLEIGQRKYVVKLVIPNEEPELRIEVRGVNLPKSEGYGNTTIYGDGERVVILLLHLVRAPWFIYGSEIEDNILESPYLIFESPTLKGVLRKSLDFLAEYYHYVNLPEDGIL